jgi:hypothetical protein
MNVALVGLLLSCIALSRLSVAGSFELMAENVRHQMKPDPAVFKFSFQRDESTHAIDANHRY